MAVKNTQAKKSKYKKVSAYWTHDKATNKNLTDFYVDSYRCFCQLCSIPKSSQQKL